MCYDITKLVVICYSCDKKMIHSASPVSRTYLVLSTLLCRAPHSGESADGRQDTQCLRRVGVTLLTNGAAFKALVYCCPCISVDSMLWNCSCKSENAVALSLLVLWHRPPRVLVAMPASFEASHSDQLYGSPQARWEIGPRFSSGCKFHIKNAQSIDWNRK